MSEPVSRRIFWRRFGGFLTLASALWWVLYAVDRALPYTEPGHELIYSLALDTVERGVVFPEAVPAVRVAVFGDSRVQAGFKPELFDTLSGGAVYSFNLGLPNVRRFTGQLRTLVARGQAPDVVVLTTAWGQEAEPSGWERFDDDRFMLERVFPFRHLLRDLTLFCLRSLSRGGPVSYYAAARGHVEQAQRDRGYFFIEGMSHFPDHRLPDDFRIDGDDAALPEPRPIEPKGPLFEDLLRMKEQAGFRVVFIPGYLRVGSRAPAQPNDSVRAALDPYGIEVRGPDYWLYPNRLFSDPAHVNPDGADLYTRDLWDLLAPAVSEVARVSAAPVP